MSAPAAVAWPDARLTGPGGETRRADNLAGHDDRVAGVRARHLLGPLWFGEKQNQDVHHQAWRIEANPAAVSVLRRACAANRPRVRRPTGAGVTEVLAGAA